MWPPGCLGSIFRKSRLNRPREVIWRRTSNSGVRHSHGKRPGHRTFRQSARCRYVTKSRTLSHMNKVRDLNTHGPARLLFWVAGLAAAVALALAPLSFHVERRLDTAVHLKGSESDYVAQ